MQNDIWTSKSALPPSVFYTFDFEMCFAPQRRALFQRNFQKRSDTEVFCTFWLPHVLRATTACIFRHLNFQKRSGAEVLCTFWLGNVLRAITACTFHLSSDHMAGSASAALASLLFDPPEPQIIGKHNVRRLSHISRTCIFFLLTLALLWSSLFGSSPLWFFPPLLFHLSILLEVWLVNFLRLISTVLNTRTHTQYIYIYVCVCVCIYIYWLSTYVNFKTKQWLERLQRPRPQNRWSQWSHGRFPILSRVEICWNILKSYEMMWSLTLLQSLSNLLHVFAWKGFYLSPWEYIRIIQNPLKHHLATRFGLSPALLQLLLRLRVESGAACSCLRRHRNHTVSHFSWF